MSQPAPRNPTENVPGAAVQRGRQFGPCPGSLPGIQRQGIPSPCPVRDRPMLAHAKCLLPARLAILLAVSPPPAQESSANPNVRFGLPAPANASPEGREAYLIERPQYVLSYDARMRTPNWVSWRLRKEDIGSASRAPFQPVLQPEADHLSASRS